MAVALHEPSDDLHIEQPSREERCGKHVTNVLRCAEKFGAALRVVDGQAEDGRNEEAEHRIHEALAQLLGRRFGIAEA